MFNLFSVKCRESLCFVTRYLSVYRNVINLSSSLMLDWRSCVVGTCHGMSPKAMLIRVLH